MSNARPYVGEITSGELKQAVSSLRGSINALAAVYAAFEVRRLPEGQHESIRAYFEKIDRGLESVLKDRPGSPFEIAAREVIHNAMGPLIGDFHTIGNFFRKGADDG